MLPCGIYSGLGKQVLIKRQWLSSHWKHDPLPILLLYVKAQLHQRVYSNHWGKSGWQGTPLVINVNYRPNL